MPIDNFGQNARRMLHTFRKTHKSSVRSSPKSLSTITGARGESHKTSQTNNYYQIAKRHSIILQFTIMRNE